MKEGPGGSLDLRILIMVKRGWERVSSQVSGDRDRQGRSRETFRVQISGMMVDSLKSRDGCERDLTGKSELQYSEFTPS